MTNKENKTIEQINKLINSALDELYDKDIHLISNRPLTAFGRDEEHHVGERAIVFRFAHYFQNYIDAEGSFKKYNLDCEYNRNGVSTKRLPSFPNGTYPDLIIHQRGNNDNNILIMEFKTYWNKNQKSDIEKIKEFTQLSGQYHFLFGVAVLIRKSRDKVELQYFYDGLYFGL